MKVLALFLFALASQEDAKKLEAIIKETTDKAQKAYVFIGGGSGAIISEDGYFFTNHHVAGTVKESQIYLTDGSKHKAIKIATDPVGDIALFKIETKERKFDYLEFADSDKLEVGDYSIAIGNPFLLGTVSPNPEGKFYPSISVGIVSAFHRHQGTYFDCVQTDAALNPGNSGGPLVDIKGRLIGINGRIAPRFPVRLNSGVGYAIPSNRVKRFMKAMLKVQDGGNVYPGEITGLLIASDHTDGKGAKVREVKKDSTAEKAGFQEGDLIIKVNEQNVTSSHRYWSLVGTWPMEEEITITLEREKDKGKETVKITLKLDKPLSAPDTRPKDAGYLGVQVDDSDDGIKITKVTDNSPAADAGIQEGDIILKLDGKKVDNAKDFLNRLWKKKNGDSVKLLLSRFGNEVETKVILGKNPKE